MVMKGHIRNGIYVLNGSTIVGDVGTAISKSERTSLGHQILGHGPTKITYHRGNMYFNTFLDDSTRKIWIYFLKSKNEAFKTFKEWKKMIETKTERKIKTLRTYNGLEFYSEMFTSNKVKPGGENEPRSDLDQTSKQDQLTNPITANLDDGNYDNTNEYLLARDRDKRQINPPQRYGFSAYMSSYAFHNAKKLVRNQRVFLKPLNARINLVPKPKGAKIIGSKWIFKLKEGIPGVEPSRYKARLAAKGITQREGINYDAIFSLVVKHSSTKILLSIVARFNMELEQMDLKTVILHGDLK
ncbi:uncharacterized protein [Cicer arietinum]|uniref:uncharacterized protein n=1 Tax=Cicer arietinum TaxID=3827 RepID=UPI003CC6CBE3